MTRPPSLLGAAKPRHLPRGGGRGLVRHVAAAVGILAPSAGEAGPRRGKAGKRLLSP